MNTSTRVRIGQIGAPYVGKRKTTYKVRWTVDGRRFTERCSTKALADAFRSKLVTATTDGVPFDIESGLPVTMVRKAEVVRRSWFDFACGYVDRMWDESSPGQRKTVADTLTPITLALVSPGRGEPSEAAIRAALRVAFNTRRRSGEKSEEVAALFAWLSRHTVSVGDLADPAVFRGLLARIEKKQDGSRAAANTIRLRRITLGSALDYAVETKLLETNPAKEVTSKRRRSVVHQVDRRSVANPVQFRTVLHEVAGVGRTGGKLVAFFGAIYHAALRPEEALSLRDTDLELPPRSWDRKRQRWTVSEWGSIHLTRAAPEMSAAWTDSGRPNEERGLKHREQGQGRTVPLSPELALLMHEHLAAFGTGSGGLLFVAERGGRIGSSTYCRVWEAARTAAFTAEVAGSPLAKRPYDLRHACVSMWLNAGVEAPRVAEWAGHSVAVLMRVYAKCIDGGELTARARVLAALGG
ncbi:hypothetical protein A6A25_02015 [Saccharothrix sp. CB00851]|nr:hypothetical protein A6A25_02015 [Saccharothrix sp. CB00851]